MPETRKDQQHQRPTPSSASRKPGERTPPAQVAPITSKPESNKKPGAGGAPSPVGENDLA